MCSNQNIINILADNPHYAARLRAVFGNDIAGPLARWLLQPSPVRCVGRRLTRRRSVVAWRNFVRSTGLQAGSAWWACTCGWA